MSTNILSINKAIDWCIISYNFGYDQWFQYGGVSTLELKQFPKHLRTFPTLEWNGNEMGAAREGMNWEWNGLDPYASSVYFHLGPTG